MDQDLDQDQDQDLDQDLDQLLDEVESKFCRDVSVTETRDIGYEKDIRAEKPAEPRNSLVKEVDSLLEELEHDEAQLKRKEFPEEASVEKKKLWSQSEGRRCCPAFVGGSSDSIGVGTATSRRSCDQLRCLVCDFRVLMFDDYEWDSSCDYLFFRNNVPDRQKLRAKLKKRRRFRAYACQCSWFCCSEPTDLRVQTQLRWVCGRHKD